MSEAWHRSEATLCLCFVLSASAAPVSYREVRQQKREAMQEEEMEQRERRMREKEKRLEQREKELAISTEVKNRKFKYHTRGKLRKDGIIELTCRKCCCSVL